MSRRRKETEEILCYLSFSKRKKKQDEKVDSLYHKNDLGESNTSGTY